MKYINTMKHIFTISYRKSLICALTLLLALFGTISSYAREFHEGDKIFVNSIGKWKDDGSGSGDWGSGAKMYLWVFGGSSDDRWVEVNQVFDNLYVAKMPSGTWNQCILTRQNPSTAPGWDGITYNKTGNLNIKDAPLNYLDTYQENHDEESSYHWSTLSSRTFTENEKIFVKSTAKYSDNTEDNWANGNAKLFLYCFGESESKWVALNHVLNDLYMAEMPSGTWHACSVTRHKTGTTISNVSWDTKWNQTGALTFSTDVKKNYLHTFKEYDTYCTWGSLFYSDGETKFRFHQYPSDWNWFGDDFGDKSRVYAYFKPVSGYPEHWSAEAEIYQGTILQVTIPFGVYESVILTRQDHTKSRPKWEAVFDHGKSSENESKIIPLVDSYLFDNQIYLHNFCQKNASSEGWQWQCPPSETPTPELASIGEAAREDINVCSQAIINSDPFTLTPILVTKAGKLDYAYDESGSPIWWHWNGSKWELTTNSWEDVNQTLSKVQHDYYYMWTYEGLKTYRRFLHLNKTTDGSCAIDCAITSFSYVQTPVNVHDSTFAFEGIVAFTKQEGALVISYGGKSQRFTSPVSPQPFSLKGLKADGASGQHLIASFEGDAGCYADSIVNAPSPESGVIEYKSYGDPEYVSAEHYSPSQATYLHNTTVTLTPHVSVSAADSFAWVDIRGNVLAHGHATQSCTYAVSPAEHGIVADTTLVLYFTEFNNPPISEDNMMGNSDYESTSSADEDISTSKYSKTSDYTYTGVWGGLNSKHDVYYNGYANKNKLFGVTTNPNVFWERYAHLSPRETEMGLTGTHYMAVFDGDTLETIAWKAETNPSDPIAPKNTNLKLKKGTTYLFSFWVANVNNFGELVTRGTKNCAILQFKIAYTDVNGVEHEHFLGDSINLNDAIYFNNFWHQNSATFTSEYDADDVAIFVVDKNKNRMRIGNDFALDDIRFRAVSVSSATVRSRELFKIKYEEQAPVVENVVIEPVTYPACGKKDFSFKVSFDYTSNTSHSLSLNINVTGFEETVTHTTSLANTAGTKVHKEYTFATTGTAPVIANSKILATEGDMKATVTVSFKDGKGKDYKDEKSSTAVAIPRTPVLTLKEGHGATSIACDASTFSVSVKTAYTYFHGDKIRVKWGGTEKTDLAATITKRSTTAIDYETTVTGLTADGKKHTLLIYTGNSLDCEKEIEVIAPKGNSITAFAVSAIEPACDETKYKLHATWTVTKADVSGSVYDNLIIAKKNADNSLTTLKTIPAASIATGEADLDGQEYDLTSATHPTIVAYLEERYARDDECYTTAADYAHPVVPKMEIGTPTFEAIECNNPKFNLVVPVTYTNQHGDMYVWIDDKESEKKKVTDAMCKTDDGLSKYTKNSKNSLLTKVVVSGLELTGDHYVTIKCDSIGSCERTKSFIAPLLPKAELVTPIAIPTVPTKVDKCDQQTFELECELKFTNQDGTLQVWVDDDKKGYKEYAATDDTESTTAYKRKKPEFTKKITLTGLPADGGTTHKIYYRFNADGYCGYDTPLESDELTFPQSPTITSTTVSSTPTAVACDKTSYTRTVTVNYKNGNGKKIVIEDEDGNKLYTSPTALTSSDGTIMPTVTLTAIDGADGHYVIAYFEGYDCKSEPDHKGTYTAPVKPIISEVNVSTVGETKCTPYKYTISGTVTYSNADVSKNLIVAYGALKDVIDITSASATVGFSISDMTATGSTLSVEAYFEDAPSSCTKTSEPFASPTQPWMEIKNIKQSTPGCNDQKYNLTFDVDYIYQHGNLTVSVDTYSDTVITIPTTKKDKQTVHVTYTGKIPADGNTHTLTAQFGGAESCTGYETLSAVLSPVITDLSVSVPTDPIDCEASSYDGVSVKVDTKYAKDKTIVIEYYKNSTDGYVSLGTYKVKEAEESHTFTGLTFADVGETSPRSVRAYLSERDTCKKTDTYSIPPTTSILPFSVDTIDHSTCSGVLYDLEGDITYTSKPADPAVRFGTYNATMTVIGETSAHYKFTNVTTEGTDLTVEAYFKNKPTCFVSSDGFNSPLKPDIKVTKQTMSDPLCPAITTTLTFDVEYTKQPAGTMTVWVDNHTGEHTVTYTANAGSETPTELKNLTVSGIPADGKTHTLYVSFSNGCEESFETPIAKFNASITEEDVTITDEFCNSDTYTATVTFNVENSQGKDVTVKGKGQTITQRATNGTNTVTFTGEKAISRTIDNTEDDKFEIYFADALSSCSHVVASYPEKPQPELVSITLNSDPNPACSDANYTVTGQLKYVNIDAAPRVWRDTEEPVALTTGYVLGSSDEKEVDFSITMPADGQTHTIHADVDGWASTCAIKKDDYTALWRPAVTEVTPSAPKYVHCKEFYDVELAIKYDRGLAGKKIYAQCTDHSTPVVGFGILADGTDTVHVTLPKLSDRDNNSHNLTIFFEGMKDLCTITKYQYNAPKTKTLSGFTVTASAKECESDVYTVTGSINSNVEGESVTIWYDDDHKTTITSVAGKKEFTIPTSFNTTGNGLPIMAYFTDHNDEHCSEVATTFDTPVKPVVSIEKAKYGDPDCANSPTTTTLTFDLNYTMQSGTLTVWVDNNIGKHEVPYNNASSKVEQTKTGITVSGIPADGKGHTLYVNFDGDKSCHNKSFDVGTAPFSPKVSGITAEMKEVKCGVNTYKLQIDFNVENSQGAEATIHVKGEDYPFDTHDGANTFTTPTIERETTTPNNQTIQISYATATHCKTPAEGTYVELPATSLGITIADNQGSVACDAADYILKGTIDYIYIDQYPKVQLGSGTVYDLGSDAYKDLIALNSTTLQKFDISKLEISVPADSSAQTLKVSAAGRAAACGTISESFKTIWRPQAGTVSIDRPNMVHCVEPYELTLTIPYTRGVSGKKIYAECTDNGNPKSGYATLADGSGTAVITLSGLKETGDASHALTLYFEDRRVSCPITSYTYDEPVKKALSNFSVTAEGKECGSDVYSLSGSIESNIDGESVTIWYDDDHKTTITSVVGKKDFSISNFNTTGNALPIKAYFTDHNDEDCSEVATTFDTPVKPVISIENAKYGDPDCVNSPTKTMLTFDLNYTMQSGTLTVWVDENIDKHVEGYDYTNSKVKQTQTGITVSGIPADGKPHTLYVNFDGDKSCHNQSFAVGTAPFSPKVSDITAEMKEVKCGVNTYKLQIDFKVENSQGAEATIRVKGTDYTLTTHEGMNTYTTPVLSREATTPNNQTVQISFASATHCKTPAEQTYVELPATSLGITIAADQGSIDCDDETYKLLGTIDYTYINKLPEVWLDDNTPIVLTESQVELSETAPKQVKLADLNILVPADGQKHHLYVKADGWAADCGTIDEEFTAVWRPQISAVRSALSKDYVHCKETYSVTLEIDYSRGVVGKKLHASCIDKSSTISREATLDAISGTATITLNGLMEQGNNAHELTLYFDGLEATCLISNYTYAEPTTIVVTEFTASEQQKDCDDVNYTVTGTIKTNFATDAKIIISDGFGNETSPLAASTTGTQYSLDVSGNDLTGTGNNLTATFVGHTSCTATSDDFNEPTKPEASVVSVTPIKPDCDDSTYELEFEISYTYQHGNVIVWVDDDHKAEQEFTIAMADRGQTAAKTITGKLESTDLVADGSPNHVLHFQFLGEHPCDGSQEGTFTAPRTPLIKKIEVERPDRILCTEETYPATVKVTTENAVGEKVIVKYTYGSTVKATDAVAIPAEEYVEIPVTFDKKEGVSHETIYVYFEGVEFEACQETDDHKKVFSTPSSSAINDFVVEIHDQTTCDNLLYSLSGTITYGGSASGDMIISFDDAQTNYTIIPMANCDPAGTPFTLSGLTKPVSSYAISAHFDGETCTSHSQEFNSPVVPTVEIANANYSAPVCNETTTNLTFDVIYTKQNGGLHVNVDGEEKTYNIKSGNDPSLSDDAQTITLVISDLLADESKRSLQVWFDGAKSCDESFNKTFTYPIVPQAPFSPKIQPKEAKMEDIACDEDTYTLDVTFTVENSLNKEALLVFRGGTPMPVNTTDGTTYHTSFTVTRSFDDPMDDFVEVYFADNTDCTTPTRIEYNETPKPVAAISAAPVTPHCDSTTFTLDFELSYTYQPEGTLTVKWDDDHKLTFNSANGGFKALNTASQTLTGFITGLPADGRNNQTLHFEFSGAPHACSGEATGIEFPKTPLITNVEVGNLPPYVAGLDEPYYPTVTVTYKYASGKKIVLEYFDKDGGSHFAYYTPDTDAEQSHTFDYTNDGIQFNDVTMPGPRYVYAYFEESEYDECHTTGKHAASYTPPTNSSIKFETLELVNTSLCEQLRYDLKGTVSFVGSADGNLIVEFDAARRCTIPESDCIAKQASGQTIAFEIKDVNVSIPAEGVKLKAWFENIAGNPSYSTEVYEPVIPTIKVENAEYQQPACNVTTTSLTFDLLYTRQQGNLHLYLTEAGNEVECTDYTITSGDPLSFSDTEQKATIRIDGLLANLSDRKLRVQFDGANSCSKEFTNIPTAPFSPNITIVETTVSNEQCNSDTYSVTVKFNVENGLGKPVKAVCKGKEGDLLHADDSNLNEITINIVPRNSTDNIVELYFPDATNQATCRQQAPYTQNPRPELDDPTITVDPTTIACDAVTYPLQGSISYRNLGAATLTIWLEGDEGNAVPVTGTITTVGETSTLAFTTTDIQVPTDNKSYTLHVKAEGDNWQTGCNEKTADIPAVWRPAITSVTATPDKTFARCDESYSVSGRVEFARGGGKHPVVACYEGTTLLSPTIISYAVQTDTYVDYTISGLKNIGATDCSVKAYFEDYTPACPNVAEMSETFAAPTQITITFDDVKAQPKDCDDPDYVVTGTVKTNADTDKKIIVTDGTREVEADASTGEFRLEHVDLVGTNNLTATFMDVNCYSQTAVFTEPTMPTASITATPPTTLPCDQETFDLEFTLNYTYQGEGKLTVWVDNDHMNTYTSANNDYLVHDANSQPLTGKIEGLPADGRTGEKLYFEFDGAHSCKGSIDLAQFPCTPLITGTDIDDASILSVVPDENDPYYPTVTVTYERAMGQTIILEYFDDKDNLQPRYASSGVLTTDKGTYVFDENTVPGWSFNDVAVAGDRKVNAYFDGAEFNNCHEGGTHTAIYRAPSNSSIEFIASELINTSTCDKLRYDLKGMVQFVGSAVGDLIVELDGTTFKTKIPEAECTPNKQLPFEIKNVTAPIPAEGKQLKAYFAGIPGNATYSTEVHQQPVIPTVIVENEEYATPQCNESVTSLTFDMKYTRQQGELLLTWDNLPCTYEILSGEPLSFSDDTLKATIVVKNITADQQTHSLFVGFTGQNSCSKDFPMPKAKYSPKVTSHKAEITNIACDDDTYTLNVSFTVENSLGKDATFVFRGDSVNVSTTDGTNYRHSFNNVARTYGDVTDDVVELSFAGNDADCSGALYSIAYTETPKPAISLTLATDQGTTCSDRTYSLKGEIRYTYLDEKPEIWLDDKAHKPVTVQIKQTAEQVIKLAELGINVPADGREHIIHIKPNGWADACPIDQSFNALQQPVVTKVEVTNVPRFTSCGETYQATVTVDYVHAYDTVITVEYTDNGSIQTYTTERITDNDGQVVITLPSLHDQNGTATITVYADEACPFYATFRKPTLNTIEPEFAVNVSTTPCGTLDYTVSGTVTFNNANGLGNLIVKYDDSHMQTIRITDMTVRSADFRIEHMDIAGTNLHLTAYFSKTSDCSAQSAPFDSPVVPDLTDFSIAVDTVFTCGDKSYTIDVAFTPTNQVGEGYVLDSIVGGTTDTVPTVISATTTTAQFVIARPDKAEKHIIIVRYPATGCEEISQALDINPYTKPKPEFSLKDIDRLCNDETTLNLPFVIKQGDIDEAWLTLTDSKGKTVIAADTAEMTLAAGMLSFDRLPAQLPAGKYTATVEARDTLECETSATQSVELALSGVVFSKWTDVLLVDNIDGSFTGYQWYQNDTLLAGKTDQVLYLPEGMSGKKYFCQIQTADGTIYTCESDFSDLPRSADNPKQPTTNHITVLPNRVQTNGTVTVQQSANENLHLILMSATGKRVAEYNQTESSQLINMPGVQGVYMLRIEAESDVQTVKIVVY